MPSKKCKCSCHDSAEASAEPARSRRKSSKAPSEKQLAARKRFSENVARAKEYRKSHPGVPFRQAMAATSKA